jgi:hypothetical protein
MENSGWNMYVFRDGRRTVSGESVRATLLDALREFRNQSNEDNCVAALIASGELECALVDGKAESAALACAITSELARAFVSGAECDPALMERVKAIRVPGKVQIAVAEGFAYYALHPRKLVDLVERLEVSQSARVVGLRSIGTTLSAVVEAALRRKGIEVERITVRPTGHPYERQLELSEVEQDWLKSGGEEALVVVVDEGPGISGSSFLATAEAVEQAGIDTVRIVMLGSREPDVDFLRAPRAAERWRRFRFVAVANEPVLAEGAREEIGGGLWRRVVLKEFETQPACWPQLESSKYLDVERRCFFKFHGYGYYGKKIEKRARKLAEAGFSPKLLGMARGFGRYEFQGGRVLTLSDLSSSFLQRMAKYCAFRKAEFSTQEHPNEIEAMANWNWECEFGERLPRLVELPTEYLVIADGRMMPHEWLLTEDGRVLKVDAVSHGDDHFFPGQCDIAWDVAGAIVEWRMDQAQTAEFVDQYRLLAGDDVRARLPEYELAYAIFRMAWSKMAAQASAGQFDEALLMRDYERYREYAVGVEKKRAVKVQAKVA